MKTFMTEIKGCTYLSNTSELHKKNRKIIYIVLIYEFTGSTIFRNQNSPRPQK